MLAAQPASTIPALPVRRWTNQSTVIRAETISSPRRTCTAGASTMFIALRILLAAVLTYPKWASESRPLIGPSGLLDFAPFGRCGALELVPSYSRLLVATRPAASHSSIARPRGNPPASRRR